MLGRCHSAQSVRTGFYSDRILICHGHSARAQCSNWILFWQNSAGPRSLCSGRILFGRVTLLWQSVRTGFCSASVTLLGQSVQTGFYWGRIPFSHSHSAQAECSDGILLRQSLISFQVSTSSSGVGTSNPQFPRPSTSEPLPHSSSQPPQPLTFQPSPSLPAKNALGDVKDQAEDEANPKPWYTADEKSSKMSSEDLVELLLEYPLHNPGKPAPNNLTKHILSHIKLQGGLYIDEPLSEQQLEWARIIPRQPVPAGTVTPSPAPTISSSFPAESTPLESQGQKEIKATKCRVAPAPKKTRKREAIKEVEEATRRAEELSKQETDYLAQIETLERRLEGAKRRVAEEVKKARDQGIHNFLDGNAGDEWLKKRVDDTKLGVVQEALDSLTKLGVVQEALDSLVSDTTSGLDFNFTLFNSEERYIESTATKIENKHILCTNNRFLSEKTISNGSSGRLVDNARHIEACNSSSILCSLALRVSEIGRDSDKSILYI
ncbi:hypothetical protein RJ639_039126 [Escallonia herrerae]|uniref:Uncharacterized protein n=1 Tax=Escallonia herrerae TaxID=1293975 RepID=A0AA89BAB8_9ASTE|nr:hypothetical protein RJ639_039126 [Escallonia herrerae]